MTRWLLSALCIVVLQAIGIAEAAQPRPISCKLQRSSRGQRLESFEMVSSSFANPSLRCRELGRAMRQTLAELAPSQRHVEFHVWLADVSTAGAIRFEARAWAVSLTGRHLRHITRATAVSKEPARSARHERIAPRVARSAVDRALRDLISAMR